LVISGPFADSRRDRAVGEFDAIVMVNGDEGAVMLMKSVQHLPQSHRAFTMQGSPREFHRGPLIEK
jgi:hypothetical protein